MFNVNFPDSPLICQIRTGETTVCKEIKRVWPTCQSGSYPTLFDDSPQERADVFCDLDVDKGILLVFNIEDNIDDNGEKELEEKAKKEKDEMKMKRRKRMQRR